MINNRQEESLKNNSEKQFQEKSLHSPEENVVV